MTTRVSGVAAKDGAAARSSARSNPARAMNCITTLCRLGRFQRREHALWRERNFAEPRAGRVEYRVRDRRRNRHRRELTRAERRDLSAVDQHDVELRHVGKSEDRITLPIEAGHAVGVEGDFFEQRAADSLDNVALDL